MAGILARSFVGLASHITSLWQLWILTLLSRCFLTLAMALSAFYVPKIIYIDPGDDVLRFPDAANTVQNNSDEESCSFGAIAWMEFWTRGLTRWDAARFLHLARSPSLRYSDDIETAERAHAFLPGYPTLVRNMAFRILERSSAWAIGGDTATTLVLASWIVNTVSSLVAVTSLYLLTRQLILTSQINVKSPSAQTNSSLSITAAAAHQKATYAALLFIVNPASVFFVAAYSEALFAALAWTGAYFVLVGHDVSPSRRSYYHSWLCTGFGLICWMAATATRSNGMLYAGYWLLYGLLGRVSSGSYKSAARGCAASVGYLLAMALIFLPLIWYNSSTIQQLCVTPSPSTLDITPDWCDGRSPWFYLYGYVQRKHWNVGFLRYFTIQQIPNFLLAAPILIISLCGVSTWIAHSWKEYLNTFSESSHSNTKSADLIALFGQVWSWAWWALKRASSKSHSTPTQSTFLGPRMLPHYAVWAVAALLGSTTAHVQISTRLLCSACPALYWYLASMVESVMVLQTTNNTYAGSVQQSFNHWSPFDSVLTYCLLYTLLGVLLHPNWLPWT